MGEWNTVHLSEVVSTNVNSYSSKDNWEYVNYLDTGNITENVIADIQYIDLTTEKLPSRAKRRVKYNSIIYSTVRPNQKHFGIIKSIPENFLVSTGFTVIDVDPEKADADFIFFLLSREDIIEHLHAIAEQSVSAYPSLKPSDIENLEIDLPDLDTQKKIASILSSITNKMAENVKINDNLQQQAQALFSSLYANADDEVSFTSFVQVFGGGTPKTGEPSYWNGNVPFFTPKDVGTPYTLTTEKYITDAGLAHCNSRLYPVNTVFITARGTVGKVGLPGVPMAMNQSCYALSSSKVDPLLVYFYALEIIRALKHKASGAVFDAITMRDFDTETVMRLAPEDEQKFISAAKPIYEMIRQNTIGNNRLTALRDSLLPRLMSGEIDISDVQI